MTTLLKTVQLKDLSFMSEDNYKNTTEKINTCLSENPNALKALVLKCLEGTPVGNFHRFYITELKKYGLLKPNDSVEPNVRQWIVAGSKIDSASEIIFSNPILTPRPLWLNTSSKASMELGRHFLEKSLLSKNI